MATFAKSTFSAASYAAFRPTYPTALYNAVLAYHRGPKGLCLDLGCGTGIVAREMTSRFDRVIGTDPSPGMIRQAQHQQGNLQTLSFREGSAESSPFLADGEVDCIVAAQAAHWFDYVELWPELHRVLRPGGTVAFWGYKDPVLVDYPVATKVLDHFTYGSDPETLGPYWSMPGRAYVQDKLRVIKPPEGEWEDVRRVEYEPGLHGRRSGQGTLFVEKSLTVREMKDYYRTFSSFHAWRKAHEGQVERAKGGKGDVIDRMVDQMVEIDGRLGDEEMVVNMEWGSGLVMCRKR